ncbi:PLDc N-terminal domain-containing protein [candidate division KSB1 bacterium]
MADPATGGILMVILILFLIFLMITLGILLTIFWIWMIVDCAKRHFMDETEKVIWILVIIIVGGLGAVIYYFAVKRPGDRRHRRK